MEPEADTLPVPIPVAPLPYEDAPIEAFTALAGITRGVAWLPIVNAALAVAGYALSVACFAWESTLSTPAGWHLVAGTPLVMSAPLIVLAALTLGGAVACLRFNEPGRRCIVATAAVCAVADPIACIAIGAYYEFRYEYANYSVPYATYLIGGAIASGVYAMVMSIATVKFFGHPSIRQLFRRDAV